MTTEEAAGTVKLEIQIKQGLADRLPSGADDRNALVSRAIERELDGRAAAAAALMGSAKSEKKAASSAENGKKGGCYARHRTKAR